MNLSPQPAQKRQMTATVFTSSSTTDTHEPQWRNQTKKAEKSNTPLSRGTVLSAFSDESD
jgi:hypothetical protein